MSGTKIEDENCTENGQFSRRPRYTVKNSKSKRRGDGDDIKRAANPSPLCDSSVRDPVGQKSHTPGPV